MTGTKEWRKAKRDEFGIDGRSMLVWRAAEIIQVLDSISWVRCSSGNLFHPNHQYILCCGTVVFFGIGLSEKKKKTPHFKGVFFVKIERLAFMSSSYSEYYQLGFC